MATTSSAARTMRRDDATVVEDEAEQQRVYDQRVPTWPLRIISLIYGVLWFTQLGWKLPWNNFVAPGAEINGVVANTNITATQPGPFIDNGNGLYYWMTQEAIYGNRVLPFYGDLVKNIILPNWQLFGWLTFFLEAGIAVLLLLGLLSRLGGFMAFVQSLNLFFGLSQHPDEWVWSYAMLAMLGFIFMLTGAGRVWGVDQWLRPMLRKRIAAGDRLAGLVYRLT